MVTSRLTYIIIIACFLVFTSCYSQIQPTPPVESVKKVEETRSPSVTLPLSMTIGIPIIVPDFWTSYVNFSNGMSIIYPEGYELSDVGHPGKPNCVMYVQAYQNAYTYQYRFGMFLGTYFNDVYFGKRITVHNDFVVGFGRHMIIHGQKVEDIPLDSHIYMFDLTQDLINYLSVIVFVDTEYTSVFESSILAVLSTIDIDTFPEEFQEMNIENLESSDDTGNKNDTPEENNKEIEKEKQEKDKTKDPVSNKHNVVYNMYSM